MARPIHSRCFLAKIQETNDMPNFSWSSAIVPRLVLPSMALAAMRADPAGISCGAHLISYTELRAWATDGHEGSDSTKDFTSSIVRLSLAIHLFSLGISLLLRIPSGQSSILAIKAS